MSCHLLYIPLAVFYYIVDRQWKWFHQIVDRDSVNGFTWVDENLCENTVIISIVLSTIPLYYFSSANISYRICLTY